MAMQPHPLLEKMAKMHSWDAGCCNSLREIALQTPAEFNEKARQIEHWLSTSKPDKPRKAAKRSLEPRCYSVYEIMVCSDPIRELVLAEPRLSKANVDEVIDYASIADVAPDPDPEIMLRSKDALFMKVLDRILKQFPCTPEDLFREHLGALIAVQNEYPDILHELYQLAELPNWSEHLQLIQSQLEAGMDAKTNMEKLPEAAQTILKKIEFHEETNVQANQPPATGILAQTITPPTKQFKPPVRAFLFGELQLATIQREEILLFHQVEGKLSEIEGSLLQPNWGNFSPKQKGDAIATELLKRGAIPAEASKPIQDRIARRIAAAEHYVELRQFVKINALNQTWPELSAELVNNRALFLQFEARMLDLETLGVESAGSSPLARLLQRYGTNDQLVRFLNLRPYFKGSNVEKAQEVLELASSLPQTDLGKVKIEKVSEQAGGVPPSGPVGIAGPNVDASLEVFANLNIAIRQNTNPSLNASPSDEEMISCQVSVDMPGLPEQIEYALDIPRRNIDAVKNNAYNLLRFQYSGGGTRALAGDPSVYREPAIAQRKKPLLSSHLKDLGIELSRTFFTPACTEFIVKALNTHPKVRFVFKIEVPEFFTLPWECLYISELRLPVALVSRHSLVRYSSQAKPTPMLSQPWGNKVRILVVFSAPTDVPHLKLEEEERVLKEIFANVDWAELLTIHHITVDEFATQMRTFNPDVIQFSGHGGLNPETGEGALIFENDGGTSQWIHASQFNTWCRDQDVRLVILNACDTGTPVANDVVTSVAGALIDAGIPAAVATTRAIDDIQSIMFVREFYRALVDGYTIESAMAEARKRVNSENWDWSAFALFVSTLDLDRYQLILEQK